MKSNYIWGAVAFITLFVLVAWGLISYYYKCKELQRVATQRHRAAVHSEKRAYAAEERASQRLAHSKKFLEDSWAARNQAAQTLEEAVQEIKAMNRRLEEKKVLDHELERFFENG